jgi:sulfur transfer complex TusBCD TusB component (DsrH family)
MKEISEDEYLSSEDFKKAVKDKLKERIIGIEPPTEPEAKMTVVEERLKAKGITKKSKFHNYDYLYKSIVEIMEEYEKKLKF